MNTIPTHDARSRLISQLRLQGWMSVLTGFGMWGLLSVLSDSNTPEFLIILASIIGSIWLWTAIQLITCILFLRPRVKNQLPTCFQKYPVSSIWQTTKRTLLRFSIFSGPLIFLITAVFAKHDAESLDFSLLLDDVIPLIIAWIVSSSCIILVIDTLVHSYLGRTLIFKLNRSSSDLSQIHHQHRRSFHNDHAARNDWYNDVTNPASPVYRATHRRSDDY